MRPEVHFQQQIAGRRASQARCTLPGETDGLAGPDATRDLDIEGTRPELHVSLGVEFRRAQGDLTRGPGEGILQIEQHLGMMVLAAHTKVRVVAAGTKARATPHAAEQFREEIGEFRRFVRGETAPENSKPASQSGGGRKSWPGYS